MTGMAYDETGPYAVWDGDEDPGSDDVPLSPKLEAEQAVFFAERDLATWQERGLIPPASVREMLCRARVKLRRLKGTYGLQRG